MGLATLLAAAVLAVATSQSSAAPVFGLKEIFGGSAKPTFANATSLAVDQSTGDLLVVDQGAGTVSRYKSDGEPHDFSALGTNVISATPDGPLSFGVAEETQIAVDNSGTATAGDIYVTPTAPNVIDIFASTGASSGEFLGQLTEGGSGPFVEACGVASDDAGDVYVGDFKQKEGILKFVPTGNPPSNSDFSSAFPSSEVSTPICTVTAGTGSTAGSIFAAGFSGALSKVNADTGEIDYQVSPGPVTTEAINPVNGDVLVATREKVIEYDASGAKGAVEVAEFALPSTVRGIAAGPSGEVYVSREGLPEIEVWEVVPVPVLSVGSATSVSLSGAVLNGTVQDKEQELTECVFEYGTATSGAFAGQVPCEPSASHIPADESVHSISAAVSGLEPSTTYRFRIRAVNASGSSTSEVGSFSTFGQPRVTEVRARADQTTATLEAEVDPRGFPTSYYFVWGSTPSYGNRAPAESTPTLGPGDPPTAVSAELSGLTPGTPYHYRIVAVNGVGRETVSADQKVETLNSCGLPEGRCFELVSRGDAGPIANPGKIAAPTQIAFQAAPSGPGALAYNVEGGYPDASRGAQVLYLGSRGVDGWNSTQLDPPFTERNETKGNSNNSAATLALSRGLSCGVVASQQQLQPIGAPGTKAVVEAGGANLYRRNPNGSYTAITALPPTNLGAGEGEISSEYALLGMSEDCSKVLFIGPYKYAGIPVSGQTFVYEWTEAGLKNATIVPTEGGGEAPGEPVGEGVGNSISLANRVSDDGSRLFFVANRLAGTVAGEVGQQGVFVREGGAVTRDVSTSETGIPDERAEYEYASASGNRVFFTANAGLTAESSSAGTDLYEYDFDKPEGSRLTDLSIDKETGGAAVGAVLGGSTDGSHVYFAARGQLVSGRGPTRSENLADDTYSVYGATDGAVEYAGKVEGAELQSNGAVALRSQDGEWTSRVSADGRYLLFQTSANVTGYQSGSANAKEAYLYDSLAGVTTCLSCRPDGKPSIASDPDQIGPFGPLATSSGNKLHPPPSLVVSGGEPKVFFTSRDGLAPGAPEGPSSIYEWVHGQVFFIAQAVAGTLAPSRQNTDTSKAIQFVGASENGNDAYLVTATPLNWEDHDQRFSVYDARVGGGFAQPSAPPAPCVPTDEGSCQGSSSPEATTPPAATSTYQGSGNAKKHKNKHHPKKHKKKKHHKRKHNGKKTAKHNKKKAHSAKDGGAGK